MIAPDSFLIWQKDDIPTDVVLIFLNSLWRDLLSYFIRKKDQESRMLAWSFCVSGLCCSHPVVGHNRDTQDNRQSAQRIAGGSLLLRQRDR